MRRLLRLLRGFLWGVMVVAMVVIVVRVERAVVHLVLNEVQLREVDGRHERGQPLLRV